MIDRGNPEGWTKYKAESDKIASRITEAARNPKLSFEEVRAQIEVLKLKAEVASFGITWRTTGGKPGNNKKKKKQKSCQEMFSEQFEVIEKMLKVGADNKHVNLRIYKLKRIGSCTALMLSRRNRHVSTTLKQAN